MYANENSGPLTRSTAMTLAESCTVYGKVILVP